ncbi:MAG: hypothetical protein KAT71_06625, partial [Gammaproteobacteria bacterium]|nr:hypothetical protein [Gammaproteobacteria bacterium]
MKMASSNSWFNRCMSWIGDKLKTIVFLCVDAAKPVMLVDLALDRTSTSSSISMLKTLTSSSWSVYASSAGLIASKNQLFPMKTDTWPDKINNLCKNMGLFLGVMGALQHIGLLNLDMPNNSDDPD